MKVVSLIGIILALASAAVAQDAQSIVAVQSAVTSEKNVLTIYLPEDLNSSTDSGKEKVTVDIHPVKIKGGYVVVVSLPTYGDHEWNKVVQAISYKYSAEILVYSGQVASVKDECRASGQTAVPLLRELVLCILQFIQNLPFPHKISQA